MRFSVSLYISLCSLCVTFFYFVHIFHSNFYIKLVKTVSNFIVVETSYIIKYCEKNISCIFEMFLTSMLIWIFFIFSTTIFFYEEYTQDQRNRKMLWVFIISLSSHVMVFAVACLQSQKVAYIIQRCYMSIIYDGNCRL